MGKDVNHTEPGVRPLGCHMPDEDVVLFEEGADLEVAANRVVSAQSRYFLRPNGDQYDNLTMTQYFEQFTVDAKQPVGAKLREVAVPDNHPDPTKRMWVWPAQRVRVCRLYRRLPKHGDVYFIRKLLMHRPARSFEDLATFEGEVLRVGDTGGLDYRGVCVRMGLLLGDTEFQDCMGEAVRLMGTPPELRALFAQLALEYGGAAAMFEMFKGNMGADLEEDVRTEMEQAGNVGVPADEIRRQAHLRLLAVLQEIFQSLGRTMQQLQLAEPPSDVFRRVRRIVTAADHAAEYEAKFAAANPKQKAILEDVKKAVNEGGGCCFFVDGPSGRGKTFLLRMIAAWVRSVDGRTCECMASTGIAAADHFEGSTAHRGCGLPLDIDAGIESVSSSLSRECEQARRLNAASVIIVDELPMLHRVHFEVIDKLLRMITGNEYVPFGGKVVITGGDFRQTTPVVKGAGRAATVAASVQMSDLWQHVKTCRLTEAMRDGGDPAWSAWVGMVGDGTAEHIDPETGLPRENQAALQAAGGPHTIALPPYVTTFTNVQEARDWMYSAAEMTAENHATVALSRAVLAPHNASVDAHNDYFLRQRPGEAITLLATEVLDTDNALNAEPIMISEEFMAKVHESGKPEHSITLKPGCIIMCLRNMMPKEGVLNGTRLEFLAALPRCIVARQLTEPRIRVFIPRITFVIAVPGGAVKVRRTQFPIRVAYSMTINKSQGKTLERVLLDLRCGVFGHGQLYVGIGRVRTSVSIAILLCPGHKITMLELDELYWVTNVVYPELLRSEYVEPAPVAAPEAANIPVAAVVPPVAAVVPPVDAAGDDEAFDAAIFAWLDDLADNPDAAFADWDPHM
jgi:energy-coupling factor transporter ATP-binding protein EcfA2